MVNNSNPNALQISALFVFKPNRVSFKKLLEWESLSNTGVTSYEFDKNINLSLPIPTEKRAFKLFNTGNMDNNDCQFSSFLASTNISVGVVSEGMDVGNGYICSIFRLLSPALTLY